MTENIIDLNTTREEILNLVDETIGTTICVVGELANPSNGEYDQEVSHVGELLGMSLTVESGEQLLYVFFETINYGFKLNKEHPVKMICK